MTGSMGDKLFFINKLSPLENYIFVDFGCADGTLIKTLYGIYGDSCRYIGYDKSEEMISFAKKNFEEVINHNEVKFTSEWIDVIAAIRGEKSVWGRKPVLILSSVLHEVYSYGTEDDIRVFWNRVLYHDLPSTFNDDYFDYVIIRDMMMSEDMIRPSDSNFVEKIRGNKSTSALLSRFESKWGSIDYNNQMIHFLLKYRYTINYDREVNENYFPLTIEEFMKKFESGWRIDYLERFRILFLEKQILKDFGIVLEDPTHIKAIFRRKNV
jgi:SAM-dependent methyltransferase